MTALAKSGADFLGDSLRNFDAFPPPVSEADQKFVESLERNVAKIKARRKSLPGTIKSSEDDEEARKKLPVNNELRKKILEGKKDLQKHEEKKEKVFMEGEKELWESGDWRDHVKDLNGSFSKLPPINRGKKIAGKGQAFVVE